MGLQVATEKVQVAQIGAFLGSLIYPDKIVPQKLEIRRDNLHTLNDFQIVGRYKLAETIFEDFLC